MGRSIATFEFSHNGTISEGTKNSSKSIDFGIVTDQISEKRCFPLGECELCREKAAFEGSEACNRTGRREKLECVELQDEKEIKRYEIFQSCARTASDEEFLMIQVQLLCVLIGLLSVLSARVEKKKSASLFDLRRQ